MPGCIVSATTASFRSVEKRRLRATPVITSTLENVSDIGTCLGLSLGPPASAGVRSKRGALQAELASPLIGLLTAFMSLEKGAAEKLFEQDAPPGPPALVSASLFRGYAAAAAAVLIRVGSTEKFADE